MLFALFAAIAGAAITGPAASAATAAVLSALHNRKDCGDERGNYNGKQYIINSVHFMPPSESALIAFHEKSSIRLCIPNAAIQATAH